MNKARALFFYFIIFLWLGFFARPLIWPFTWLSIPILLCFGYAVFRFIFETTINKSQHSVTMATCFVARQKTAIILAKDAAQHKGDVYQIVDLGSGRGELARYLAKKIPKVKITGIEQARFPFLQASFLQRLFGLKNVSFKQGDFWDFKYSDIDAVTLYLGPITVQQVGEKLYKELKTGSIVISQSYPLQKEWTPDEILTFRSPFKETIYVYRKE